MRHSAWTFGTGTIVLTCQGLFEFLGMPVNTWAKKTNFGSIEPNPGTEVHLRGCYRL